jgi:hypothetical protein
MSAPAGQMTTPSIRKVLRFGGKGGIAFGSSAGTPSNQKL